MTKLPMTKTEEKAWAYILGYATDNGYMPTRTEIGIKLGFHPRSARQTAQGILRNMEKKGHLKLGTGWRNIKVVALA